MTWQWTIIYYAWVETAAGALVDRPDIATINLHKSYHFQVLCDTITVGNFKWHVQLEYGIRLINFHPSRSHVLHWEMYCVKMITCWNRSQGKMINLRMTPFPWFTLIRFSSFQNVVVASWIYPLCLIRKHWYIFQVYQRWVMTKLCKSLSCG